jgi:putative membrane protein
MKSRTVLPAFFREALAWQGSVTPVVLPLVIMFGLMASLFCILEWISHTHFNVRISLPVPPYEIAGAALSVLIILRTNSSYERWWEGRRLWGGIVNQCRNFCGTSLAYGPRDEAWRRKIVTWTAAFPHACRLMLRGQRECRRLAELLGNDDYRRLMEADHLAMRVSQELAAFLREPLEQRAINDLAFAQADRERAQLMDHQGACERIMKTPLARVYSIKIRRMLTLFLITLPFALLHKLGNNWLVPPLTMMAAYPLLAIDQIAVELQNPFSPDNMSHLPLDEICTTIDRNVHAMLAGAPGLEPQPGSRAS